MALARAVRSNDAIALPMGNYKTYARNLTVVPKYNMANVWLNADRNVSYLDISLPEMKIAAQARRPILSNRPVVPIWVPFFLDMLLILAVSGFVVFSLLIVVDFSSGFSIPILGKGLTACAFLFVTGPAWRMRSSIQKLS